MTKSEILKYIDRLEDNEEVFIEGPLGEGTFFKVKNCTVMNFGSLKKPKNVLVLNYED